MTETTVTRRSKSALDITTVKSCALLLIEAIDRLNPAERQTLSRAINYNDGSTLDEVMTFVRAIYKAA